MTKQRAQWRSEPGIQENQKRKTIGPTTKTDTDKSYLSVCYLEYGVTVIRILSYASEIQLS